MILGATGLKLVELGGERAWMQRTTGDIVSSFQWLQLGDDPQACLCLFPAARHVDTAAYVIPQRNAHAYALSDGGATPALMACAFTAASHMGMHPDKSTVHRIMDIVLDAIPDLIRMPSDQPADLNISRRVYGIEATATVNGKVFDQSLI